MIKFDCHAWILALAISLFLIVSLDARADYAAPQGWTGEPSGGVSGVYPSTQEACESKWALTSETEIYYGVTSCGGDPYTCTCSRARTGSPWCAAGVTCGQATAQTTSRTRYCPSGGTYDPATNFCIVPVEACPTGTFSGDIAKDQSPSVVCESGCTATVIQASNQCSVGGVQRICGTWAYDVPQNRGDNCTGSTVATGSAVVAPSCPVGECLGTFNGATICLACSASNPAVTTKTSSSTDASGVTTNGTTTIINNGDTTTTTTTNVNASTGATQTTSSTGTPGAADQGGTEKAQYCRDNPTAPECVSSSWAGSCGAFSCSGDAVQCAISREIHTRNCSLFDAATPQSTLANQVISGADPDASGLPGHPSQLQIRDLSSSIDASPWLPASGGLADKPVSVGDYSFVIPFSKWNEVLSIMGSIVLAFSYFAAARIVAGAVTA